MENEPTFYPLRSSEESERLGQESVEEEVEVEVEPDWEAIQAFENQFINRFESVGKETFHTHEFYPEVWQGEERQRLFLAAYEDNGLTTWVEDQCAKYEIDLENDTESGPLFKALFVDLQQLIDDGVWFTYLSDGASFYSFYEEIQKILNKKKLQKEVVAETYHPIIMDESRLALEDQGLIDEFFDLDLASQHKEWLAVLEGWQTSETESKYKDILREAITHGQAEIVPPPVRHTRLREEELLVQKEAEARALKQELKPYVNDPKTADIAQLYLHSLNVQLADWHTYRYFTLDKLEPSTYDLRAQTRTDHYLQGVTGEQIKEGESRSITPSLVEFMEQEELLRAKDKEADNTEYKKYNENHVLNLNNAKKICEAALIHYELDKADPPWRVKVIPGKTTFSVGSKPEDGAYYLKLPGTMNDDPKPLIERLAVIEHELVHVLQATNRERLFTSTVKLMLSPYHKNRGSIMREAGAMYAERQSLSRMVGKERPVKPYYYEAIRAKSQGQNFTGCLLAALSKYAEIEFGLTLDKLVADEKKYQKATGDMYQRVKRLFGSGTQLSDTTPAVTDSDQLKYVEQELLARNMEEFGLGKYIYVGGMDIYEVPALKRLGVLDTDKILEPDYFITNEVWPRLKAGLDSGQTVTQAIDELYGNQE